MPSRFDRMAPYLPQIGCLVLALLLVGICVLPLIVVDAMQEAMHKLHLGPTTATLVILGIILGGLVNLPIYRLERPTIQVELVGWSRILGWTPVRRMPYETIIAVNLGGCLIPLGLSLFELIFLIGHDLPVYWALLATVTVNVFVCFWLARPIPGVGIVLPGFIPPLVAVGCTWLLLLAPEFDSARAPVAFVAGVLGPLLGADLLHLKDISRISAGVLSIGGAGTFDGIVLSGILAALLA